MSVIAYVIAIRALTQSGSLNTSDYALYCSACLLMSLHTSCVSHIGEGRYGQAAPRARL